MEGYSVTEAASVLGVAPERVWELLARGVLAGQPEGETGMRVFLQPRPAPAAAPAESASKAGGNGEEHHELSPFRELLTEFRNLTERYGQALLALGEARGEVAALRSRVDLLEARMDLRLPSASTTGPPVGWAEPVPRPSPRPAAEPGPAPEPQAERTDVATEPDAEVAPMADAEPEVAPMADAEPEPEVRTVRRSMAGRATEGFAEALARAEDPSVPELLGGAETAAALAALRAEPNGEVADDAEVTLPRELPPAADVPVAEESVETKESSGTEERDDDVAPDAGAAEAATVDPSPREEQPEPDADPEEQEEPDSEPAPIEADETEAPAWRDERYTAEIGDPDWWESEALPEPAAARAGDDTAADEPVEEDEPEASHPADAATASDPGVEADDASAEAESGIAEVQRGTPSPPPPTEPAGLTRLRRVSPGRSEEETVLWFGRSPRPAVPAPAPGDAAGEMEVAPTGRSADDQATPDEPPPPDDPFAALEALSRATPGPAPRPGARPQPPPRSMSTQSTGTPGARPVSPTPAGRAYRRLRRIFPG